MSNNIGVITEQGDLGLGFDPLSNKDQKTYKNNNQQVVAENTTARPVQTGKKQYDR